MSVTVEKGTNDMPFVKLSFGKAEAHVYLHGAHVTYWRTEEGAEPLYLSPGAVFSPTKAIRGGVPICWPQFGDMGPCKPAHGFARVSQWQQVGEKTSDSGTCVTLLLTQHDVRADEHAETKAAGWDTTEATGPEFQVRYTVALGHSSLNMQLRVVNSSGRGSSRSLSFTTALHTYFSVSHIDETDVSGFDKFEFLDNLQGRARQAPHALGKIGSEVDRIYPETHATTFTIQSKHGTTTVLAKNMPDAVLWNPWVEKTKKMSDMPPNAYEKFVCVESGLMNAAKAIVLQPGEEWCGEQGVSYSAAGKANL